MHPVIRNEILQDTLGPTLAFPERNPLCDVGAMTPVLCPRSASPEASQQPCSGTATPHCSAPHRH
eukprot:6560660-Pyramimonas_sp.AAC.1